MKKLIIMITTCVGNIYPIPGTIIDHNQEIGLPIVSLRSLDLKHYEIMKTFNTEDLPETSNWQQRREYYIHRNRTVYCTKDKKFVLKVWQAGYAATPTFLSALHAGFYTDVALLSALIADENNECRGYISPYMVDRTSERNAWESFGCVLEKGPIQVRVFSDYDTQPPMLKKLWNTLLNHARETGYVSLDFCPNNVAINTHDQNMYLVDLEDVQTVSELHPFIISIFSPYLPTKYLDEILTLAQN